MKPAIPSKLKNISLFWHIFLPISLIVVICTAVAFIILASSENSKKFTYRLYNHNFAVVSTLSAFATVYQDQQVLLLEHLASESAPAMAEIKTRILAANADLLERLEGHIASHRAGGDVDHDHLQQLVREYGLFTLRILQLSEDFEKEQGFILLQAQGSALRQPIKALVQAMIVNVNEEMGQSYGAAVKSQRRDFRLASGALVFAIGISILLAIVLARKISQNIGTIVDYAEALGAGNFAAKIDRVNVKEFSRIVDSLHLMGDGLHTFFNDMRSANARLADEVEKRKVIEEELKESKIHFQNLVEGTEDLVTQVDGEGRLIYVNHMAEKFFGVPPEECSGLSVFSFVHPDDRQATIAAVQGWIAAGKAHVNFDNRQLSRDGREHYLLWTTNLHYDDRGNVVNINSIATDITERKKIEALLVSAMQSAEAAAQLKGDFLANMSHELRTPLHAILGFADIMEQGMAGPLSESQENYIAEIHTSGKQLLALVNDVLDVSKIDSGQTTLEPLEFNLADMLDSTLFSINKTALAKEIEVTAALAEGLSPVKADPQQVEKVLAKLLDNALKFTPAGGRVGIEASSKDGEAELAVWDTGIGIGPEDLSRLFKPFEQVEHYLQKQYGGTGLGLHLSKKRVELAGGRIWAESEGEGKGSRFIFTLPLVKN
ncbi:MAG: ATP-binding protein [Desulfobulbaceae bacterium]|nr:ATP-binding protein [Desulfobulbaceae bacterium]